MRVFRPVLVVCLLCSPWRPLRGLFEFPPLVWLGQVSYGIYLWHIGVFWMLGKLGVGGAWFWPASLAALVAVAALSFYALERPMLRFKRRFARVGTEPLRSP